jgi:DNA-binding PadR family transcriptional regulator
MSSQNGPGPSLESLVNDLNESRSPSDGDPAAKTESVVEETTQTMFGGAGPDIDDGLIKQSLPELLVLLVGLRENETHGKGIMEDLSRFFGADLSPGTVYPTLHDLEEEGVLEMRELIQTKEYGIEDADAAREALGDAMGQHLALGVLFHRAISELDDADA